MEHGSLTQKFQLVRTRSATPISRTQSPLSLVVTPSTTDQNKLASAFAAALKTGPRGYQLQCLGNFICSVPSRIGHNPALDAAVACVLEAHSNLVRNATGLPHSAVATLSGERPLPSSEYMRALRILQEVIEHPVLGFSSETVCATILMTHYEMMIHEKRGSQYLAHAGAATKLIVLRGPQNLSSNFEKELWRTQRGHMIIQAFLRQEDCILFSDGWRSFHLDPTRNVTSTLVDRLVQVFSALPSLVKQVRGIRAATTPVNQVIQFGEDLQQKLALLSAEAEHSSSNTALVFKPVTSQSDDGRFPSVLRFQSTDGAMFHTWYWAVTIIIEVCIMTIYQRHDELPRRTNLGVNAAARKICMSYEYAAALRPLGAQFLQLPLICAHFVGDDCMKEWIVTKLNSLVAELHIQYTSEYVQTLGNAILGI
ncbi:hypothetical protein G647_02752 [Cladophialophora carrionii CBS 160.54]|uniref:Transcription factor domain-containing protein n=1 Tax=Cladophialophora carrionii CBS 160.54 TaxID=1279043 RepID=V9DGK1_9EURO|nr:uncharacterized protein G647_02752 [Cladophialophora carrionii CBS 160.54]ETI25975.1 hypothetical protein G647_02752 [Cladophialophora carrionii CBS 160.54]